MKLKPEHLTKAWKWMLIGSVPFVLASIFEMFVLTIMNGPQALFFSFAHGGYGLLTYLVLPSMFIYPLTVVFGGLIVLASFVQNLKQHLREKWVVVCQASLGLHVALFFTYPWWSYALFG